MTEIEKIEENPIVADGFPVWLLFVIGVPLLILAFFACRIAFVGETSNEAERLTVIADEYTNELRGLIEEQERLMKEMESAKTPAEIEKLKKEDEALKKKRDEMAEKAAKKL
jgi:hypothetical protein